MARAQQRPRRRFLGFAVLVVLVITSGVILASQGDLISPIQSTTMLISMSSGEDGFAMVGDRPSPPDSAETITSAAEQPDASVADTSAAVDESAVTETTSEGTMTLEQFTAELAAAGVDVESVSATMSAEGRSLENLLAVVNSGRTTVADLAVRLSGATTDATSTSAEGAQPLSGESSTSLIDFRWDEIGSVAYNLWVMLAATVAVIVIARPAGWLVNRIKRSPRVRAS